MLKTFSEKKDNFYNFIVLSNCTSSWELNFPICHWKVPNILFRYSKGVYKHFPIRNLTPTRGVLEPPETFKMESFERRQLFLQSSPYQVSVGILVTTLPSFYRQKLTTTQHMHYLRVYIYDRFTKAGSIIFSDSCINHLLTCFKQITNENVSVLTSK